MGRLGRWPAHFLGARMRSWRSGSSEGQAYVFAALVAAVLGSWMVSWHAYDLMPLTAYFVWLLVGMLVLRFLPLTLLSVLICAAGVSSAIHHGMSGARYTAAVMLGVAVALVLVQSSRQRSGLPVTLSEAMLAELRDRLQRQGVLPVLPDGWAAQSAMLSSHGVGYAGDFFVAELREDQVLEMVLVDVCGKGVAVGPQALQFAGALGGLLGALPPHELMGAANRFLLRQDSDESFATAVHLAVDLASGAFTITSAGHPPAMRWDASEGEWRVDAARGTALGVTHDAELHATRGTLAPGDALMFYTDGVVESRSASIDDGIAWLRGVAREAVGSGFPGAARRIVHRVESGDDDRAVLIIDRSESAGD